MKMKTVLIILGTILLIFLLVQVVYHFKVQNGIESYPYKVVKSYDKFEIRGYEASLFTTVKLNSCLLYTSDAADE